MPRKKRPVNQASNLQRKAAQLLRAQKVVELKAEGLSFGKIAEELGIKGGRGAAHKLWQAARSEVVSDSVEAIRAEAGDRYNELFRMAREIVFDKHETVVNRISAGRWATDIVEKIAKLYGAELAKPTQVTGKNGGPILTADVTALTDEQLERIIAGDTSAFTSEG